MAKRKVGRPKRKSIRDPKDTPGPKHTRNRYSISIKKKVVELRKEGMSLSKIKKWLLANENMDVKTTTICTWYSPDNTRRMEEIGDLGANNNDTCITKQRPRIIVDTETVLSIHVRRSQENGLPLTFLAASVAAGEVYSRLRRLGIYSTNGQRSVKTDALTESHINFILNRNEQDVEEVIDVTDPHYEDPHTGDTNDLLINSVTAYHTCFVCDKKVYNSNIFTKHLHYHTMANVADVAATITDVQAETENVPDVASIVEDYSNFHIDNFKASIGWVQKFVKRNDLGTYILKGEKGSNDYAAAVKFTKDFTTFLARESFLNTRNILTVLINFDEGGIQ